MTLAIDHPIRTPFDDTVRTLAGIAAKHGFTLSDLKAPGRKSAQVEARRACYVFLREHGWSTVRIGKYFHRDHTTVVWHTAASNRRATRVKSAHT